MDLLSEAKKKVERTLIIKKLKLDLNVKIWKEKELLHIVLS